MMVSATLVSRFFAPAILAGALAGSCLADTTPVADAVVAQCARLFFPASSLAESLDAIPGLTRLPLDSFAPEGAHGRALRMALAYNRALQGIMATALIAPEDQLMREFEVVAADTPWLYSAPGQGGGVAAYADDAGRLFIVDRAITSGRQGRRETRCLFIAPPDLAPLVPALPENVMITDTPSASSRGFNVSARRGRIPFDDDQTEPASGAGFSMVTMPVPPGTALADLAGIGGVTIFRQSTSNRSSQ